MRWSCIPTRPIGAGSNLISQALQAMGPVRVFLALTAGEALELADRIEPRKPQPMPLGVVKKRRRRRRTPAVETTPAAGATPAAAQREAVMAT